MRREMQMGPTGRNRSPSVVTDSATDILFIGGGGGESNSESDSVQPQEHTRLTPAEG